MRREGYLCDVGFVQEPLTISRKMGAPTRRDFNTSNAGWYREASTCCYRHSLCIRCICHIMGNGTLNRAQIVSFRRNIGTVFARCDVGGVGLDECAITAKRIRILVAFAVSARLTAYPGKKVSVAQFNRLLPRHQSGIKIFAPLLRRTAPRACSSQRMQIELLAGRRFQRPTARIAVKISHEKAGIQLRIGDQ